MNYETEIWLIYIAIKDIHKRYVGHIGNIACLPALDGDIGRVVKKFGDSKFASDMTAVLRRWFVGEIEGIPEDKIVRFYRELWLEFHKKYINMQQDDTFWRMVTDDIHELDKKYGGCRQAREYMPAIADELERST